MVGCIIGLQQGGRAGYAIISSSHTDRLPPKGLKVDRGGFTALPSRQSHLDKRDKKNNYGIY